MKVTIENKEKELYYAFRKALVSKEQTLRSFCEINKLDYNRTYQRLNAKDIDLQYYKSLHDMLGASCFYNLTLSIYGKTLEYKS